MKNNRKGASIVELCAGLVIFIPVVLALLDVIFVSLYKTETDSLAKRSAIAAATTNYGTTNPATTPVSSYQAAAQSVLTTYNSGSLASPATVTVSFINNNAPAPTASNPNPPLSSTVTTSPTATTDGIVTLVTTKWNLPVPIPFGGPTSVTLMAQASSPLVNNLPVTSAP